MMSGVKVKVVEVCKVVPPPPSTTTTTTTKISLPLTQFDYLYLRYQPTQRVFFYKNTSDEAAAITKILSQLKHSLSLTLQHYLPLAGKLVWPPELDKPSIRYVQGDGVSLTVAEAAPEEEEDAFHHFTADENIVFPVDHFCPLVPELSSTQVEASALALQVTFFGGQGFSIAYNAHHAVVDGKSITMFMHAWATTCRNMTVDGNELIMGSVLNTPPPPRPCYDRSNVYDPTDAGTRYLSMLLNQDGPNNKSVMLPQFKSLPNSDLVRKTFSLTRQDIDRIKISIQKTPELVESSYHQLSTYTTVVAYTWVNLVKSKNIMVDDDEVQDDDETFHFAIPVDARGRLQPPLPSTYFGNCVLLRDVFLTFHDLVKEDGGVAMAAKVIREEIQGLKNGSVLVLDVPEESKRERFMSPKGLVTTVGGSPKFQVYNVDFGWGKPVKVEMTSIKSSRSFGLLDSRDGNDGGVEVGIVLRKHEMEIFSSLFTRGLEK